MNWFTSLPVQVQAALIAAVVTLAGILLKDVIFKILQAQSEKKKSELEVFRRYADPLASTATSVLWRFNEIFTQRGRANYLASPITEFDYYKKVSTAYRLAALLGWIRAFRRELSFLEIQGKRKLAALKRAINAIESALADGPHIELRRLESLAELWNLTLPQDQQKVELGVALDNIIKPKLHSQSVKVADELADDEQRRLCVEVAGLFQKELSTASLTPNIVAETTARAIQRMTITEAWIYRDWQAAIGDLMIKKHEFGGRTFEVIGFGEFERMWYAEEESEIVWIERLSRLFDGLDVDSEERYDARIQQLRQAMRSTARLIVALVEIQPRRAVHLENTLRLAHKILLP